MQPFGTLIFDRDHRTLKAGTIDAPNVFVAIGAAAKLMTAMPGAASFAVISHGAVVYTSPLRKAPEILS